MGTAGIDSEPTIQGDTDQSLPALSKDTAFMILKNSRRREVLRFLARTDGEATLDELARHIAAKENGIDKRALSSSQRKRVYIGLYQAHLPKMDDAGVVEFDKHRGRIELCPVAVYLFDYLRRPERTTPRPGLYVTIAVGTGLLAGLGAMPLLDVPWIAGFVVVAVATVAGHVVYTERVAGEGLTNPDASAPVPDGLEWRRSEPR